MTTETDAMLALRYMAEAARPLFDGVKDLYPPGTPLTEMFANDPTMTLLIRRGWVAPADGGWVVTEAGRRALRSAGGQCPTCGQRVHPGPAPEETTA